MLRDASFLPPLLILFFGAILVFVFQTSGSATFRGTTHFLPPPENIEHFSLGYNEVVADVVWLRLIQDIDHCENATASNVPEALQRSVSTGGKCEPTDYGWAFHMLDTVTKLSPKFQIAYAQGGAMLSVVIHDRKGAAKIYDRGIENFPKYWPLQYASAYHHMSEMHDNKRAAELLLMAGKNGAPGWVNSLAVKLYTELGQALFAKNVLEKMIEDDPDSRWTPRLRERLKEAEDTIAREQSKGSGHGPAGDSPGH